MPEPENEIHSMRRIDSATKKENAASNWFKKNGKFREFVMIPATKGGDLKNRIENIIEHGIPNNQGHSGSGTGYFGSLDNI